MSILDHPIISERYFFPRWQAVEDPRWVKVQDARLACYHREEGNDFTIVHFHGNGEVCADYVPRFPRQMAKLGADTFLAEYRGYGGSTGKPQLRAMLDDVGPIFDAVGRPPEEIIVFGRSVGSIYAVEMAHRFPVAGLILESGIADPAERILMRATPAELGTTAEDLDAEFQAHLDHRSKLADRELPTLVMHCQSDSLVSVSHAIKLAAYPRSGSRLVIFDRGDHNSILSMNEADYLTEVELLVQMCRRSESYSLPEGELDEDTLQGGLAVFRDTQELVGPGRGGRTGPGQTDPLIEVAGVIRRDEDD